MGANGEALQHHTVYKSLVFYYKLRFMYGKSRENLYQYYKSHNIPYQVLQVTIALAGSECNESERSYDKIIITIVPSYT